MPAGETRPRSSPDAPTFDRTGRTLTASSDTSALPPTAFGAGAHSTVVLAPLNAEKMLVA